jgi:hypothetical protein
MRREVKGDGERRATGEGGRAAVGEPEGPAEGPGCEFDWTWTMDVEICGGEGLLFMIKGDVGLAADAEAGTCPNG